MKQQTLANVLLPPHMHTTQSAGLQQVRERPLQLLATLAQQPLAARAPDPSGLSWVGSR